MAFPLISAGIYGYPQDQALQIAKDTIEEFLSSGVEMTVYLVLFPESLANPKKKRQDKILVAVIVVFVLILAAYIFRDLISDYLRDLLKAIECSEYPAITVFVN